MNTFRISLASLAVISALGITACQDSANDAPAAKSAVVSGVITGFGSIFINGVEYETGGSSVSLDGTTATESDLKLGMVVTLDAVINPDGTTGVAKTVSFSDELEGMVSAVTIAADGTGTVEVMGQTVTIDANTAFESKVSTITAIGQLVNGNIVEISGFSSGTGTILATRVEVKKAQRANSDTVELKGVIANLDTTAHTFKIGEMTIVYSDTTTLENLPTSGLANGLFVEVKNTAGTNGSGQLIASKIEVKGTGKKGIKVEKDKHMELEGLVTAAPVDNSFMLNGQAIKLLSTTEFKGGTLSGLVVGVRIKVEITADDAGNIVAKEIHFATEGNIQFQGSVEAVDTANNTVTIMGQVIKIANSTITQDKREEGEHKAVRFFGVKDVLVGQRVKIRAYKDASGAWIATKFERENSNTSPAELNALIDSVGTGTITVAGITVNTAALTNATFTVGKRIELRGTYAGGVFTASSVDD